MIQLLYNTLLMQGKWHEPGGNHFFILLAQ